MKDLVASEFPRQHGHSRVGFPWTTAEEDVIKKMFAEGSSVNEIVDVTQRSHAGIIARLQRLGLIETVGMNIYKKSDVWFKLISGDKLEIKKAK